MVHSQEDYEMAVEASQILFGKATASQLRKLDENTFLSVFEGVPMFNINKSELMRGVHLFDLLTGNTSIFPSRGELKRTIKGNGLSINQEKITDEDLIVNREFLIGEKYILVQKGKKNYSLIIAVD
jgi:tyrosyl-tRNA synthetase